MGRRYRETCINAYLFRRQRSIGYVYNGGMPGNIYSNPEIGTSILFQENWSFAVAGSDLVANVNPAKWSTASYLAGAAPTFQYDGAGNIISIGGAGPPAVKLMSVPLTFNIDKAHSLVCENCGIGTLSSPSVQNGNLAPQMESANVFAGNSQVFVQPLTGEAVNHSDSAVQVSLNGVITNPLTGVAGFIGVAGAVLKQIVGAWNGTNRDIWTYLNGVLIQHQVTTTRGVGTNKCLKLVMGCCDHQNSPNCTIGRITFKGFAT